MMMTSKCLINFLPRRILFNTKRSFEHFPVTYENVVFPPDGQYKLPKMPEEPVYDTTRGEAKYKTTSRLFEGRGYEPIQTELIHKQFGLMAISGGFITAKNFDFIQTHINNDLQAKQFAIWRVDAPWLPRTRKPKGTKMGGGKGSISRYVTPVRANRIILEVGGHITEPEARSYLMSLPLSLPFPVEFVSQKLFDLRRELEERIKEQNENKFDWDTVIKYNMQSCRSFISQYDLLWKCRYK